MIRFILIFFLLFGCLSLDGQRREPLDITIDFESYDPPSTLVVPEHPTEHAKFPFIDVHSHHWGLAEKNLDELIAEMDELNMKIVVNLSGRGGVRLKNMMDNIHKYGYADRIINFTNINLNTIDEADWAEETIKQLEYDRGDPRLDPIWEKCGELGMPVLIHSADPKSFWVPHDSLNERWLELKLRPGRKRTDTDPASWETIIGEQHDIFRRHPGTTFINAHMGWYPNDLGQLAKLLDEIPNMYVEIGAVIAELGRQPRMAKRFFEAYQDRILFGKDSYKPKEYPTYFRVLETADEYFPYYKRYHAFWRMYGLDLSDDILEKLYYKNALKIIPDLDPSLWSE